MSYQRARGEAIAQLTKYGLPYHAIEVLLRAATAINRYAELACSSEAADRDRITCPAFAYNRRRVLSSRAHLQPTEHPKHPCLCDGQWIDHAVLDGGPSRKVYQHATIPRYRLQDWRAEQRAIKAISGCPGWSLYTSGDPRGYTLHVIPPAYNEENAGRPAHDKRSIGVPPGPSGLRF